MGLGLLVNVVVILTLFLGECPTELLPLLMLLKVFDEEEEVEVVLLEYELGAGDELMLQRLSLEVVCVVVPIPAVAS